MGDRREEPSKATERVTTPSSPITDPFGFSAWWLNQALQNSSPIADPFGYGSWWLNQALQNSAIAIRATQGLLGPLDPVHQDDAPVGILRLDDSLGVLSSNAAARELIGADIALGTRLDRVLRCEPPEILLAQLAESADRDGPLVITIELPARGGEQDFPTPIGMQIERIATRVGESSGWVVALIRLPLAQLRMISDIRSKVMSICALDQEPEALLRSVLTELKAIIPFDIATYYEHAAAGDPDTSARDPHASSQIRRIRFAFAPQAPDFRWPMRWLSIPKVIDAWSRQPQPEIDDLDAFIAQLDPASAHHLTRHLSIRAALKEGLRAFLYFPMYEGDRIVSALSLAARTPRRFGRLHWQALYAIDLRQVLEFVRIAYGHSAKRFSDRVADLFRSSAAPRDIANRLVREIADEFGWDYVGIFRVARALGRFEVVAQAGNIEGFRLPDDYTQALDTGALGTVLREKSAIRCSNVDRDGGRIGYINLGAKHKSCLCFPVSVGESIEWIIDCESVQEAAFGEPDEAALHSLIDALQATLQLWFEKQLNHALLEQIGQGVIVTDGSGNIQRMNETARRLLAVPVGDAERRLLDAFAADEVTRQVLRREVDVSDRHVRLKGSDGAERGVLVSARLSSDAFNRWIWLLTDVMEERWQVNLRYVRALAQEVAQETRGQLMLANSLVKRVVGLLKERKGGMPAGGLEFLDRASRNLARTDITYERLAQLLHANNLATSAELTSDLAAILHDFRERLSDGKELVLNLPPILPDVQCPPNELAPALRSLLGYLIAHREPDSQVVCAVTQADATLTATLSTRVDKLFASARSRPSRDALEASEQVGREDAALAFDSARAVFERAGGKLRRAQTLRSITFTATLPVADM